MLQKLKGAKKVVYAEIIGVIGWATSVVNSEPAAITASEWIALATVVAIGAGVYGARNEPAA